MTVVISIIVWIIIARVPEMIPYSHLAKPLWWALALAVLGHFCYLPATPQHFTWKRWPFYCWTAFSVLLVLIIPYSLWLGNSVSFIFVKYNATAILLALVVRHLLTVRRLEQVLVGLTAAASVLGLKIAFFAEYLVDGDGRIRATLGGNGSYDSNDLSLFAVMVLPFALYWVRRGRWWAKPAALLCAALVLLILKQTGSRGGILAFGGVMAYLMLFGTEMGKAFRITLLVGGLVGGLAFMQTKTFDTLYDAVTLNDYNMTEKDGRFAVWMRGLSYAEMFPLTGVGPDNFGEADRVFGGKNQFAKGKRSTAAHNSFVQIVAETGFPGLILFCAMLASSLWELRRQRLVLRALRPTWEVQGARLMGRLTTASLGAYCIGGFFLSMGYFSMLYLVIGYVLALANVTDRLAATVPRVVPHAIRANRYPTRRPVRRRAVVV